MNQPAPAVVLLSGGLDSATTLAIARQEGFDPIALTFDYGQRHASEIAAARRVAAAAGVREQVLLQINLRAFGGSALTAEIPVPKDRPWPGPAVAGAAPGVTGDAGDEDSRVAAAGVAGCEIPITYVPARNTIFLSYALALAEVRDARDIFLGINAIDYSGYPDCRPEYLAAFERMAALATRAGVAGRPTRIHAPLLKLSKAEIIARGLTLGVDYGLTRSCYDPDESDRACGRCDSCRLRRAAFAELGRPDPAPYQ